VGILEEDRLQVVVIRLEDLEVRPGGQFRQLEFEDRFGPRGKMPGQSFLDGCQEYWISWRPFGGWGSGDDGVAEVTGSPSAGGTGGGPVVTSG